MIKNNNIENLMTNMDEMKVMANLYEHFTKVTKLGNSYFYKVGNADNSGVMLVNAEGKNLLNYTFDDISDFNRNSIAIAKKGRRYYLISIPGNMLCSNFNMTDVENHDDVRIVKTTEGGYLLSDRLKKFINTNSYDSIIRNGDNFKVTKNGRTMIVDKYCHPVETVIAKTTNIPKPNTDFYQDRQIMMQQINDLMNEVNKMQSQIVTLLQNQRQLLNQI